METITGHIKERVEHISGEIKEYCDQEPVLVKDSAGTLLYTKNPGEIATITDGIIKDAANNTLHLIKAQGTQIIASSLIKNTLNATIHTVLAEQSQIIANCNVQNSDNSYNVDILAEGSLVLPDITVTKGDGSTSSYPAAKDYTETPNTGSIFTSFRTTYDMFDSHIIPADEVAIYDIETLVNVATVEYKVNTIVKTLPITLALGDTFLITITQTNPALDSSVKISY